MSSSKLGFGMMRLPQCSPETTDIDFEQVSQMVDQFLEAAHLTFDTSWAFITTEPRSSGKTVSRQPPSP